MRGEYSRQLLKDCSVSVYAYTHLCSIDRVQQQQSKSVIPATTRVFVRIVNEYYTLYNAPSPSLYYTRDYEKEYLFNVQTYILFGIGIELRWDGMGWNDDSYIYKIYIHCSCLHFYSGMSGIV